MRRSRFPTLPKLDTIKVRSGWGSISRNTGIWVFKNFKLWNLVKSSEVNLRMFLPRKQVVGSLETVYMSLIWVHSGVEGLPTSLEFGQEKTTLFTPLKAFVVFDPTKVCWKQYKQNTQTRNFSLHQKPSKYIYWSSITSWSKMPC